MQAQLFNCVRTISPTSRLHQGPHQARVTCRNQQEGATHMLRMHAVIPTLCCNESDLNLIMAEVGPILLPTLRIRRRDLTLFGFFILFSNSALKSASTICAVVHYERVGVDHPEFRALSGPPLADSGQKMCEMHCGEAYLHARGGVSPNLQAGSSTANVAAISSITGELVYAYHINELFC